MKEEKLAYIKLIKESHENCIKAVALNQNQLQQVISEHNENMKNHLSQMENEVNIDPKMIEDIYTKYSL